MVNRVRQLLPHIVTTAPGSAQLPEAVFHVGVWVAAVVCEALFQMEYTELNEKMKDSHWSWPIMHGSIITLAIPLAVVLAVLFLHICGRELAHGEIFGTITAIFPTSAIVSLYFMLIQFFNMVLMEANGSTVDFGGLPALFVSLVFFKVYLSHVVTHQIEIGARMKTEKVIKTATGVGDIELD